MFIGIETDERGKALDEVAFKSIGTLASAVLREAELRAARQATAANEDGGGSPDGRATNEPPMRSAREGSTRKTNGKGRGATAPPVNREVGRTEGETSALRLVSNRCEPARNAASSVFPARRAGSHLVLVGGRDHASPRKNLAASSSPALNASISTSMPWSSV